MKKINNFKEEIKLEISARHVHLSENDMKILFGENSSLEIERYLSQPEQYLSKQKISIVGPKGAIENVSILGPLRGKTQVEISLTDARKLGVPGIIRLSGDIEETPGIKLKSEKNELCLNQGVIVAKRHIHLDTENANLWDIKDQDEVMVEISSNDRNLIFDNVIVRVSNKFSPAMHIDTDEANAGNVDKTTKAYIYKK